jgi:hypothetical protein
LSKSEYGYDKLREFEQEIDSRTEKNNLETASIKQKLSSIKHERLHIKREMKSRCNGLKGSARAECVREAEHDISIIDNRFEEDIVDLSTKINKLTVDNKDMKKEMQLRKKLAKEELSQQAMLENKCIRKK